MEEKYSLGEIVISNFSGISRHMYQMSDIGPVTAKESFDNLLNIKDLSIVIDVHLEDDGQLTWIKIFTSAGMIGYVPSNWVKQI